MLAKDNLPTTSDPQVLIVDRSDDNREVLRTVLQRHGCRILEANHDEDGLRLAKQCHPRVVVLDLDTIDSSNPSVCAGYDSQARADNASVLLLGRYSRVAEPLSTANIIAKPYHYGPLIRKIETLLHEAERT